MTDLRSCARAILGGGALVLALVGWSPGASALSIEVAQESSPGAGDFDSNVLGFIDPFASPLSIAAFYQYGTPNGASYNGELNGGPNPVSSLTQVFFVTASDGVNAVVVHDNPDDGSGGSVEMTLTLAGGAGGTTAFTVEDDGNDGTAISDVGADRVFDTVHDWLVCCTDGVAIGDLGMAFTLFASFDTTPTGIDGIRPTGSGANLATLNIVPGQRLRFQTSVVPLPAAAWLLLGALGTLGIAARRRRTA